MYHNYTWGIMNLTMSNTVKPTVIGIISRVGSAENPIDTRCRENRPTEPRIWNFPWNNRWNTIAKPSAQLPDNIVPLLNKVGGIWVSFAKRPDRYLLTWVVGDGMLQPHAKRCWFSGNSGWGHVALQVHCATLFFDWRSGLHFFGRRPHNRESFGFPIRN